MLATFSLIGVIVATFSIVVATASPIFILPGLAIFLAIDRYWMKNPDTGQTFMALLGLAGLAGIIVEFIF